MTVSPVEHYCSVIERLLDGAFAVADEKSAPQIVSASFQDELGQCLAKLQKDLENGAITVTEEDRERLNAVFQRILKLEGMAHARLSWFADLEENLRRYGER